MYQKQGNGYEINNQQAIRYRSSEQKNNKDEILYNKLFYEGQIQKQTQFTIDELLLKREDYDFLEKNHTYIQWLFPNFFKSSFNSNSYPLKGQEVEEFLKNKEISKKYFKSYKMIMNFMGIKIVNKLTGELEMIQDNNQKYHKRFQNALFVNIHNRLRLMRILASLSTLGYRNYAIQLCKFLKQILDQKIYARYKVFELEDKEHEAKLLQMIFFDQKTYTIKHFNRVSPYLDYLKKKEQQKKEKEQNMKQDEEQGQEQEQKQEQEQGKKIEKEKEEEQKQPIYYSQGQKQQNK